MLGSFIPQVSQRFSLLKRNCEKELKIYLYSVTFASLVIPKWTVYKEITGDFRSGLDCITKLVASNKWPGLSVEIVEENGL